MLKNLNNRGLSKSKKVEALNYAWLTGSNITDKKDDVLDDKPESLIVHVGTNNLTSDINLLNKKIVTKTKEKSPNTTLRFSNIIICKDKKTFEKLHADTKSRLKKYFIQKNLNLHEKWNFSLRLSSVNLTKCVVSCGLASFIVLN